MYCTADIERLVEQIKSLGLSAPQEMLSSDSESLCKICNGIGCEHPEHVPYWVRFLLNKIMFWAKCSAAIHDWRYANSDGKQETRLVADKEFRQNLLDEISNGQRFFKWGKEWAALRAYNAVRKYGYSDWCIAFAEKNQKNSQG
nr:MAG TPA: hypothetical protein [Caudoviricetes sp.]